MSISSKEQYAYLALSMATLRDKSPMAELMLFLGYEDLMTMVNLLGGTIFRIPTPEEFSKDLLSAIVANEVYGKGRNIDEVFEEHNIDGNKGRSVRSILNKWERFMLDNQIDILKFLESVENVKSK